MTALALGDFILKLLGGLVLFLLGAFITRFIFSIGKIVRLLEKIADSPTEAGEKNPKEIWKKTGARDLPHR